MTPFAAEALLTPGAAGWLTAVTSVGLLGPVLYWLAMHHLPAKDAQMKAFFDKQHELIKEIRMEQEQKLQAAIAAFKEEARDARESRASLERQMGTMIEVIRTEAARLTRKEG